MTQKTKKIVAIILTLVVAILTSTSAILAEDDTHVIKRIEITQYEHSARYVLDCFLTSKSSTPGHIGLDDDFEQSEVRLFLKNNLTSDFLWKLPENYELFLNEKRELLLSTPDGAIFNISFGHNHGNVDSNKPGFVSYEDVTYVSNEKGFSVWEYGIEKIRYQINGLENPQFDRWDSTTERIYMHSGTRFGYFSVATQTYEVLCNDFSLDAQFEIFCNSLFYKAVDGHPKALNLLTNEIHWFSNDIITSFVGSDSIRYIDAFGTEKFIPHYINWDGTQKRWI